MAEKMASREEWDVTERQEIAVSISRPGKSIGVKRGSRDKASAMRCVLPGVHLIIRLYIEIFCAYVGA